MSVSLKNPPDVLLVTSEEPGSVFLEGTGYYNEASSSKYHIKCEYFCVPIPIFQSFDTI